MSFDRPDYTEIIERMKSDIETNLDTGTLLSRSFLAYLAEAYGGAAHGLHGHLEWNYEQLFPDTADAENLARWASIWGISRKAAAYASGDVVFIGTNGVSIPQGTVLKRADGLKLSTTQSALVVSGTATVEVSALAAGEDSNTDSGTSLTLETTISGLDSAISVDADGISGGSDEEDDSSLRARLLERIKNPPHGGSAYDYESWALEVENVTRATVIPLWDGLGTVAVYIMDDNADTAPIPDTETVDAAQAYIDEERPVTADVTIMAPTAKTLDLTIALDPDTATVRAAVEANIKDLITRDAEPGGSILLSRIREAVSQAAGEADNTVSVPSANFSTTTGEIAVYGEITWT